MMIFFNFSFHALDYFYYHAVNDIFHATVECQSSFWCSNKGSYQTSTETKGEEEKATPRMPVVSTIFSHTFYEFINFLR